MLKHLVNMICQQPSLRAASPPKCDSFHIQGRGRYNRNVYDNSKRYVRVMQGYNKKYEEFAYLPTSISGPAEGDAPKTSARREPRHSSRLSGRGCVSADP